MPTRVTKYLLSILLCAQLAVAEPVKIGVIAPLTGGLADRGEEIVRTVKAFESFYLTSSQHSYEFVIEDGKNGLGNSATVAAQKFIAVDGIKFLITGTSGETIQAGMVAEKANVVAIGVLATVPKIREIGEYVFRTYVDIKRGLERLHAVMKKRHSSFALLSEEAPFTLGIKKLLTGLGKDTLVFSEDYPADSTDFRTILTKLKASAPEAIYLNCVSPKTFNPLLRQLRELGIHQQVYTYFMPSEPQVQAVLGELLEGIIFIDMPQIANDSKEFTRFMAHYRKQHPEGPLVEFLLRTTHDALKALTTSIETVGPDPLKVKNELYQLSFKGALGEVSFDEGGDIKKLDFSIRTIRSGKVQAILAQ